LIDLCLRSKAVWGYDEEFMQACRGDLTLDEGFMQACRGDLTLTASLIRPSYVRVAEIRERLVGVAQVNVKEELAELDKLFIEPTRLRSGAGKALFEWAVTIARDAGAVTMVIDADPNAAGFYRRMGAVDDGMAPSGTIPGRFVPRLKLWL
jgi:GNAT superfamily N-acetyltransferase